MTSWGRTVPLAGTFLTAGLAFVTSAGGQSADSRADSIGTEQQCEFYFHADPDSKGNQTGDPISGSVTVSPGCEFFYFPGVTETQLASDAGLFEFTGSKSHFRVTPEGNLLFIVSPKAGSDRPPKTETVQTDFERVDPSPSDSDIESQALANRLGEAAALVKSLQAELDNERSISRSLRSKLANQSQLAEQLTKWKEKTRQCLAQVDQCGTQEEMATRRIAELKAALAQQRAQTEDNDADGVIGAWDQCPNTPANIPTDRHGCAHIELRGVEFVTGTSSLTPVSHRILRHTLDVVKSVDFDIEVEGHTDNVGSDALNQILSQQRADTVAAYLVEHGVSSERISAKGYGASRPIADNETKDGRQRNRRVEIKRVVSE